MIEIPPQPTHDHGSAGFCTGHWQAAETYDGPTVDHSTPGEAPPFPDDLPPLATRIRWAAVVLLLGLLPYVLEAM